MKIIVFAEKPKCRGRQALFVCSYYKIPITYHLFDFLLTGKRYYYTLANESVDIYFLPSPWKIPLEMCNICKNDSLQFNLPIYNLRNNKMFTCILTMNTLYSNTYYIEPSPNVNSHSLIYNHVIEFLNLHSLNFS